MSSLLSFELEHPDEPPVPLPLIKSTILSGHVAIERSHAKNMAQQAITMIIIARSSFISLWLHVRRDHMHSFLGDGGNANGKLSEINFLEWTDWCIGVMPRKRGDCP
jgi:hypothetical protein